jgi:hypothetical protein
VKKKPLQVRLHAREPSVVELTLGDRVQLDRMIASPRGVLAERHGRLLDRGVNTVTLAPGHYVFQTLSNASLHVVTGGVSAVAADDPKDPWPPPASAEHPVPATGKGDDAPGERPNFTID